MSIPLFTIGRASLNLYNVAQATGVIGWPDIVQALAKISLKMLAKSKRIDNDALDDMVSLAQARCPVDTGLLLSGIKGEVTDDGYEFSASAVHPGKCGASEDYARLVEFGHHEAGGAVPSADFEIAQYEGRLMVARLGRRTHKVKGKNTLSDVAPEPFFFSSAREALEKRGEAMDDVLSQCAAEDGWQTS